MTMLPCTVNALYKGILWVLTHRWSSQRLSSDQLSRAKTIQEVTELGVWGEPHTREDETETERDTQVTTEIRGWGLGTVESKMSNQINHILLPVRCEWVCSEYESCVLTFPRSCSCSCCRLWTPGWPAESSCSSSPPPGPSPCSSGSCCVTSYLLLLHAQSHMRREERWRERERKSDKDCQSMTLNHSVTVHIDYYWDTCAFIGSLKNRPRGKPNTNTALWMTINLSTKIILFWEGHFNKLYRVRLFVYLLTRTTCRGWSLVCATDTVPTGVLRKP